MAIYILKQIICAMYQFHRQGLTLKELNPQHILILQNKIKLGYNLGFFKNVSFIHNLESKSESTSLMTMAPEYLNYD